MKVHYCAFEVFSAIVKKNVYPNTLSWVCFATFLSSRSSIRSYPMLAIGQERNSQPATLQSPQAFLKYFCCSNHLSTLGIQRFPCWILLSSSVHSEQSLVKILTLGVYAPKCSTVRANFAGIGF